MAPPPPPAGAPPPPKGALAKLKELHLWKTQITNAGCATLAAALDSGAMPVLTESEVSGTPASPAAKAAVMEALGRTAARAAMPS